MHRPVLYALLEVSVRLSWPLCILLLMLTLGTGLAVLQLRARSVGPAQTMSAPKPGGDAVTRPADDTPHTSVRSGPWGELRATPIVIEPLESAAVALIPAGGTRWVFPHQSPVGVERLLQQAGMSSMSVRQLEDVTHWDPATEATIVSPSAAFVLEIPSGVRATLYAELGRFPANSYQAKPFRFRHSQVDQWFQSTRLSPQSIGILRKLTYTRGDTALISDVPAACQLIESMQERAWMLKVLSRTPTLMVSLKIGPDTDVDALTGYWGVGKRLRDVRPLIESLTRVPEGHLMDVAHLLPRFARKRLYAFPARDGRSLDPPYDCHWTSLNFWNDPPDDRMSDTAQVVRAIVQDYAPVPMEQCRFGDIVLLGASENELIHSCVYIAADIVFTKNGPSHLTPWVLMELDDLLAYYEMPERSMARAYRLKEAH